VAAPARHHVEERQPSLPERLHELLPIGDDPPPDLLSADPPRPRIRPRFLQPLRPLRRLPQTPGQSPSLRSIHLQHPTHRDPHPTRTRNHRIDQQIEVHPLRHPNCTAVLGEETINRAVGGPDVIAAQTVRLLELADLAHVDLLVLPCSAGAHPGGRGEFTLLDFPEAEQEPLFSYAECYQGSECSEDPTVIANFEDRLDIILSKSLPIEEFIRGQE